RAGGAPGPALAADDKVPPLARLEGSFDKLSPEEARTPYGASAAPAQAPLDRGGPMVVYNLLTNLGSGMRFDEAFERAALMPYREFAETGRLRVAVYGLRLTVNGSHPAFGIALPRHRGADRIERRDLVGHKRDVARARVLSAPLLARGTGNRDDVAPAGQQPGNRQLRGRALLPARERLDALDDLEGLLEVLSLEARIVAPPVVGREIVDRSEAAGEEAAAERAVGDEADAQGAAGVEDALLRIARPQRVFRLQCGNRVHRAGAADRVGARLGAGEGAGPA